MQVTLQDRLIEALREEVIDQLIMNYGHRQSYYIIITY